MEISELQQIAEGLKELNDKIDTLTAFVMPEEDEVETCDLCGIEVGGAVGICNEPECPYSRELV